MYKEIQVCDLPYVFTVEQFDKLTQMISKDILKHVEEEKIDTSKQIIGNLGYHNVPSKMGNISLYIEFQAGSMPFGFLGGVRYMSIFDGLIPDQVLDRFNALKKSIEKTEPDAKFSAFK